MNLNLDEYINNLYNHKLITEKELKNLKDLLDISKGDDLLLLYHIIGVYYYNNDELIECKQYFDKLRFLINKNYKYYFQFIYNYWLLYRKLGKHNDNIQFLINLELSDEYINFQQILLAETYRCIQEFNNAEKIYQKLKNWLITENNDSRFISLYGYYLEDLGNINESKKIYEKAKELALSVDNREEVAHNLLNLSNCYLSTGEYKKAEKVLMEAISIYDELYMKSGMADCYSNLGYIYDEIGNYDTSIYYYNKCLEIYGQMDYLVDYSYIHNNIGVLYEHRGMLEKAKYHYLIAYQGYISNNLPLDRADITNNLANIEFMAKKYKSAEKLYNQALSIYENYPNKSEKVETLFKLGEINRMRNSLDRALYYYNQANDILKKSFNKFDSAIIQGKIAYVKYQKGFISSAIDEIHKALNLAENDPNPYNSFIIYNDFYELDPNETLKFAVIKPYGWLWIKSLIEAKYLKNEYVKGKIWKYMWLATNNMWNRIIEEQHNNNSIFMNHWKFKQILLNLNRSITSETIFNFLLGANDLHLSKNSSYSEIKDEQNKLERLWFVEYPLFILHSDKYVKIRVNNRIQSTFGKIGFRFPILYNGSIQNIEEYTIIRMKIRIETQWLKLTEIDNIFYPNTPEEQEAYLKDPKNTILSDIFLIDLEDKTKQEDNLELNFLIKLNYSNNQNKDDIITTSSKVIIPIIRNKRVQIIEKRILKNQSILAIILATWSILSSIIMYIIDLFPILAWTKNIPISKAINTLLLTFGFMIIVIGIPLFLPFNNKVIQDRVSDYQ